MEGLIRDIIELDKKKRLEVEELKNEKNKVSTYIREKRHEIEKKHKKQSEAIYSEKKSGMDKAVIEAEHKAKDDYANSLKKMELVFDEHRQEWIESLYEYSVDYSKKEEQE